MRIQFNNIIKTKNELEVFDRTNPYNVAALAIHVLCNYEVGNDANFKDMLQYLMGDYQMISPMMMQNIKDRMMQNKKYGFIGKSYFVGATPQNDYTPSVPYEVEVSENPYSRQEEGYIRFLMKSGGADSERPLTVRLAKDGNYYLWSDSIIGLLADIRPVESSNPWA